jgi:hypothetical protein
MCTKLYLKVIDPNTMLMLKKQFVETMSTLNKVFLPACFDVMTHVKGIGLITLFWMNKAFRIGIDHGTWDVVILIKRLIRQRSTNFCNDFVSILLCEFFVV